MMSVRDGFLGEKFKGCISNKLLEIQPFNIHGRIDREFRVGFEDVVNFKSKLVPLIDSDRLVQDYSSGFMFLLETGF